MREIKFRAWDLKSKTMHGGDFFVTCHGTPFWNDGLDEADVELMQFTGLKDKNGKEIYEGDILDWPTKQRREDGVVKFQDGGFWLVREYKPHLQPFERHMPSQSFREVIGNIYQNSDLL